MTWPFGLIASIASALFGRWLKQKSDVSEELGKAEQGQVDQAAAAKSIQEGRDVENRVDAMSGDDVQRELREWTRKPGGG